MGHSVHRKIGAAALIMMASIFLSRLLGMLRESILSALIGANAATDAYKVAFILPEILNHILASGFFSVTFIPIFARYLAAEDEEGGWEICSTLLSVLGVLLALLIVISMVAAPHLISWLQPGRTDPHFLKMAVRMTRIILPAQLFFFAGGMFMAVQFAKERFFLPAMSGLIYNLGIILCGVALASRLGVEGFAWGALLGAGVGSFFIQWIGARKAGLRFQFNFNWRHPDLLRYVALTLPLMLGLTMNFSTEIFSKLFGSFLEAGAITQIDFAWRLIQAMVGFFGQAVGVAAFPFLAKMAAAKQFAEMNRLFNNTLRYLALVIPVSFLVFVVRHELVRLLFERGPFTSADTRLTALALSGMLIGAVGFAAQTVVNRGFYAMQNTLLPAIYGTVAVLLSLPLYWIGVTYWGVMGIGMAISCSALIQVVVLFAIWNRKSGNTASGSVYIFYVKCLVISLPVAGCLMLAQRLLGQWLDVSSMAGSIGVILTQSLLFLLLMAIATWAFKIEEASAVWGKITARFFNPAR